MVSFQSFSSLEVGSSTLIGPILILLSSGIKGRLFDLQLLSWRGFLNVSRAIGIDKSMDSVKRDGQEVGGDVSGY